MGINRKNEIDFRYGPLTGIKSDGSKVIILSEDMLGEEFVVENGRLRIDTSKLGAVGVNKPIDPTLPDTGGVFYQVLTLMPESPTTPAGEISLEISNPESNTIEGVRLVSFQNGAYTDVLPGIYWVYDFTGQGFSRIELEVVVSDFDDTFSRIKSMVIVLMSGEQILMSTLTAYSEGNKPYTTSVYSQLTAAGRELFGGEALYNDVALTDIVSDGNYELLFLNEFGSISAQSISIVGGSMSFNVAP